MLNWKNQSAFQNIYVLTFKLITLNKIIIYIMDVSFIGEIKEDDEEDVLGHDGN